MSAEPGVQKSETTSAQVVALYRGLESLGIGIWIDGGWGVDALLGEQTRKHADVDIVVEEKHVCALRSFLVAEGFREVPRDDTRPWNFVLENDAGCGVDVHVVVLDPSGNGIYGPPENGTFYPSSALSGRGTIGGVEVRCLSPEYQIGNHTGYKLKESDYHDVLALAERFGLALPEEYRAGRRER